MCRTVHMSSQFIEALIPRSRILNQPLHQTMKRYVAISHALPASTDSFHHWNILANVSLGPELQIMKIVIFSFRIGVSMCPDVTLNDPIGSSSWVHFQTSNS